MKDNTKLLEKSVYELMSMGGDHRITIDENIGCNIYGCKPYPSYSIAYSSSTGSNISLPAYGYIKSYFTSFLAKIEQTNLDEVIKDEFEQIRQKLRDFYELDPSVDFVFGPSGTDIEYVALAIAEKSAEGGVHNIILGADEVGSGIKHAAMGRYFSELTPAGNTVDIGDSINGFIPEKITATFVPIRSEDGSLLPDEVLLEYFEEEIDKALKHNQKPLLHIIHSSKTGLIIPSWDYLLKLKNKFGDKIDIIVDACQGRMSIYSMNRYLSFGAMILLTGSKFLSGPPFSGVLLLPSFISNRIKSLSELPSGFENIFGEAEFPLKWMEKVSLFKLKNVGLLLRWQAAIYEMNKIFRIPNQRLKFVIDTFRKYVFAMIAEVHYLSLVDKDRNQSEPDYVYERSPFEVNTICTICITHPEGPKNKEETKIVHQALYSDISNIMEEEDNNISSISIQLGQPVQISENNEAKNTTLRIALGANQISELALLDNDLIETKFAADMQMIEEKLNLILANFDFIKQELHKAVVA